MDSKQWPLPTTQQRFMSKVHSCCLIRKHLSTFKPLGAYFFKQTRICPFFFWVASPVTRAMNLQTTGDSNAPNLDIAAPSFWIRHCRGSKDLENVAKSNAEWSKALYLEPKAHMWFALEYWVKQGVFFTSTCKVQKGPLNGCFATCQDIGVLTVFKNLKFYKCSTTGGFH